MSATDVSLVGALCRFLYSITTTIHTERKAVIAEWILSPGPKSPRFIQLPAAVWTISIDRSAAMQYALRNVRLH